MFTCGRCLQVAILCGLLLTTRSTNGSTTTDIPSLDTNGFSDVSSIHAVSVDPADLIFDYSASGTLNFSAPNAGMNSDASSLVQLTATPNRHSLLEKSSALTIESTHSGDFVVPIPAIGIGWTLLIGAAMYRVGVRVLRVRT